MTGAPPRLPLAAKPAANRMRISRWTGRLTDPALEAAFRDAVWHEWSTRLRNVSLIGGTLVLSFGYTDYLALGLGTALYLCWLLRFLVLGCAIGVAQVSRVRDPARLDAAMMATLVVFSIALFVVVALEHKGIMAETPGAVLMVLGFYVFVPTAFLVQLGASLFVTVGFLGAAAVWLNPTQAELVVAIVELMICNVLGAYTALETHTLRRRSWLGRRRVDERLRFEALVARLSTGFIGLPLERIDDAVTAALAGIGDFAGADDSYVVVFDWERGTQSTTHGWRADGKPQTGLWRGRPLREPAWVMDRLLAGETVQISDPADIPPEGAAVREILAMTEVRATACVPMMVAGRPYGFVGFSSRRRAEWAADPINLLRIAGEMIVNVLERKRAELELRSRKQALEAANQALVESNVELQQFAYVASHDLQEPLRSISGYASLLAKRFGNLLDGDGKEYLRYLTTSAQRLHTMIVNLLDYSRVDGRPKPFVRCSTRAIVRDAVKNLQVSIDELGALVECDSLPVVEGDPSQLLQLFQNLIGNAIKFHNGEAPQVRVSARRDAECWEFLVADNGIGIDPKYRDRLFKVFSRLHTKDQYPGNGIGLAVCKRIVERHHGRIDVQANQPNGSVFRFTLPAAD